MLVSPAGQINVQKRKVDERLDIGGPHPFHEDPARKLTHKEIEAMCLKAAKLKAHLEK